MQMSEVADLVDEHRATGATRLLVRTEHELVENELTPALEQVGEAPLTGRPLEGVVPFDPHHRQATALGRARVVSFCTPCSRLMARKIDTG